MEISAKQSKRITILKTLLTVFVVYIHSNMKINVTNASLKTTLNLFKYLISDLIPRCAVPGFFLISAIMLYRKPLNYTNNLKKKGKSLLIPYLLINTFWVLVFLIAQKIPFLASFFHDENNIISSFGIRQWLGVYGILSPTPILGPMWFIRNLIIYNLLAPIFKMLIDHLPKITIVISFLLAIFLPCDYSAIINPLNIFMWLLGCYIATYKVNIDLLDNDKRLKVSYFGLLIICLILKLYPLDVISLLLIRLETMVSVFFFYALTSSDNTIFNILYKISKYSFGIYLFHEMIMPFLLKVINKVFGYSLLLQLMQFLLLPILTIIIAIMVCMVLNKILPNIYKTLMGNR